MRFRLGEWQGSGRVQLPCTTPALLIIQDESYWAVYAHLHISTLHKIYNVTGKHRQETSSNLLVTEHICTMYPNYQELVQHPA